MINKAINDLCPPMAKMHAFRRLSACMHFHQWWTFWAYYV